MLLRDRNAFFNMLFLVTAIPIALPLIYVPSFGVTPNWNQFLFFVGVIGNVHVGMTAFFFLGDKRYLPIIRSRPWLYVWAPLASIALGFAMYAYDKDGFWLYVAANYCWLLWHFSRQNFGLYALLLSSSRSVPADGIERRLFDLLPVAGSLHALTLLPMFGLSGAAIPILRSIAYVVMLVCTGMLGVVLMRSNVRNDGRRVMALLLAYAFFLPAVLSENPSIALTFFAHPMQYIVVMTYLAGDRRQGNLVLRLGLLVTCGAVLWLSITFLTAHALAMGLALAIGVTQAHFLIDSGLWRLKEHAQRSIIQESFDFLFQPQPVFSKVTRRDYPPE
jgi:hypothetical protein